MKRTLIILAGLLIMCTNLYAAGDLIVNGKLGVGTSTPTVKLDVVGDMRVLSPDQGIYSLIFERTDEDNLQHAWKIWHMNQSYSKNALEIYEYKTGTDGISCSSTQGGFCKLRLSLSEGGNLSIGDSRPGNDRLYVKADFTKSTGAGINSYTKAIAPENGSYYNHAIYARIEPNVSEGVTNSGYATAIEASPLNSSQEYGTLAYQYGVRIYYGNYDNCSGSCGVGTITNSFGIAIHPRQDNGVINNSYALFIGNPTTGATVDNNWGIYQTSPDMNNYFAGAVAIAGAIDPNYMLTVGGEISATHVNETSDGRLKDDIKAIDSPIKKVMDMKGVSFNWKTDEYKDRHFPEGTHYGVIAQEIEKVLPDVVTDGANGEKSVAYSELIPILIEAVKEQQRAIDKQQGEIEKQKNEIDALKAEMERLKPQKVAAK